MLKSLIPEILNRFAEELVLMPVGEPPLMMQALERGVVDVTSLSIPASFVAKSKGFSSWSTMTTSAWLIRCTL